MTRRPASINGTHVTMSIPEAALLDMRTQPDVAQLGSAIAPAENSSECGASSTSSRRPGRRAGHHAEDARHSVARTLEYDLSDGLSRLMGITSPMSKRSLQP